MSNNDFRDTALTMATVGIPGLGAGMAAYYGGRAAFNAGRNALGYGQFGERENERIFQQQFDSGANEFRRGNQNGLDSMADAMLRAEEMNTRLDTRGVNDMTLRQRTEQLRQQRGIGQQSTTQANNQALGFQGAQATQANQLLDNYTNQVNALASGASSAANQVPGVVDMGLRSEEEARSRRDGAFSTQLGMQMARYQADLDHMQALRARPLNRDVAHQEADAILAQESARNRGQMSNTLLTMYGNMAASRAGMYRA